MSTPLRLSSPLVIPTISKKTIVPKGLKMPARVLPHVTSIRSTRRKQSTVIRALPDIVSYSEVQLVTWVLPMTIAGRIMNMEYTSIAKGLVALGVFKTCLHVYIQSIL